MILAWIITILVIKQWFSSSIIASPSSNWYSTVRTSLSPSLLYLLIFFNYLFLFKVYHIHLIFKWAGSSWLLCHSDMSSSFFFFFFEQFFTSWHNKMFRLFLYFPCSEPAISPRATGSFSWGIVFRNQEQELSMLAAGSITAYRFLQKTELGIINKQTNK